MEAALNFLTRYKQDGNDLLKRIIAGDESGSIFTNQKENQRTWFKKK